MPLFQRIEIERFRRLASACVELRNLCVLIGANGVGKTTFLDAFWLLAQANAVPLMVSVATSRVPSVHTPQGHWTRISKSAGAALEVGERVPHQKPVVVGVGNHHALTVGGDGDGQSA